MENNPKQNISSSLLALNAVLVVAVIGMVFLIDDILHRPPTVAHTPTAPITTTTHAFENISVQARAVYVYDLAQNKILFQKNAEAQLPLASLTKLMMALVASNLVPANSRVTIRPDFLTADGNNGLVAGESWKLKDLLDFSLVVSSNDGARSIASVVGADSADTSDFDIGRKDFINSMNQEAQTLGLAQTYFINENGLDVGNLSGGYGSAENVSKLLQHIITQKPTLLEATKYPVSTISSATKNHTAKNTDTIISDIPGLIASKTGYTTLAGGNLAVAFDVGLQHPIIIVVLGSTQDGRFTDVSTLVKATLAYVRE